MSVRLSGTPASTGVSIGPAFLLEIEEIRVRKKTLRTPDEVDVEIKRFHEAIQKTRKELELISERVNDILEGRQLIEVHMLLLNDPTLTADVEKRIRKDQVSAEYAVSTVLYDVLERFNSIRDPYLRNRSVDVRDVGRRIMANLLGTEREALMKIRSPVVLVSRDLDPSQTAGLSRRQLLGIATDLGGSTSHTSILARSMGVPAVVGLGDVAEYAVPGQTVIIDGIHGTVILDPDDDELKYYSELKRKYSMAEAEIALNAENPAMTADGTPVELSANIEFSQEADQVRRFGGVGIGLFRTEFISLLSPEAENEEELHYRAYRHVLRTLDPDPVIIRTLDLGGDKFLNSFSIAERNPFLGWRAIRVCLDRPEKFSLQLRALLRAAVYGNLRIMIPMITGQDQVTAVRDMLHRVAGELDAEGVRRGDIPPLGIMVETPAAVLALDFLLPHSDFVSIGSNDLTQYTLAVDRGSPYVARLFDPFHPAVIRQIEMVARRCSEAGKWAGICGQMASNPLAIPLLLGFGLSELSVPITLLPDVKEMIGALDMNDARRMAAEVLGIGSGDETRQYVLDHVESLYPDIILDEIHRDREDWRS